mmetsp:Transcript_11338/g.30540  ORF Transcript_11338/g.30540 Transcript_11338/m.30540 type:complete len:235 (-) Transcript_11338:1369-2073(-)
MSRKLWPLQKTSTLQLHVLEARNGSKLDTRRFKRTRAQSFASVLFVFLVVAFEPHGIRIAFKRENVRRDAIQKPAIVADHHHASGKVEQRVFKIHESFVVDIVRGLVKTQQVSGRRENLGQRETISLSTAERAHSLLLIRPLKIEPAQVSAAVDRAAAQVNFVASSRDFVENRPFVVVQRLAILVHVHNLDGLTYTQRAIVGFVQARDHLHNGTLPGTIRPNNSDNPSSWQLER